MEHISPIILAIVSLLGGGGVVGIFFWLDSDYRKKRINEWRQAAAQSNLETSKIKLQTVRTEQDQLDWMLSKMEELKINQSNLTAEHSICLDKVSRLVARRTMENTKLAANLFDIVNQCEDEKIKAKLNIIIITLKKSLDE